MNVRYNSNTLILDLNRNKLQLRYKASYVRWSGTLPSDYRAYVVYKVLVQRLTTRLLSDTELNDLGLYKIYS